VEISVVPCSQEVQTTTVMQETDANVLMGYAGPILAKFHAHGGTVDSAKYSALLQDQLKPEVRHKRGGLLSKGMLLLHDSARPHTATATIQTATAWI
jgi:hypothetical protein